MDSRSSISGPDLTGIKLPVHVPGMIAPQQFIVTFPVEDYHRATDVLVTVHPDGGIEVATRRGPSSWGPPLPVREAP